MVKFFTDIKGQFSEYLSDEADLIKNGKASRIYFPKDSHEVKIILKEAFDSKTPVTISGGGTGLSGGRVPLEGWILATNNLKSINQADREMWTDPETNIEYGLKLNIINNRDARLIVPVSMTVKAIQNYTKEKGWFYPPDPTERTCFIGGNLNTNASGARTFKFGPTRNWIQSLEVILIDGTIFCLDRSISNGHITDKEIMINQNNKFLKIPRPTFKSPNVLKNVAGPLINNNSHVIDTFIGTGGLFGVTTQVTLKLIREPQEIVSIFVFCKTMEQVYSVIRVCQKNRESKSNPIAMAVEFLDLRAIKIMHEADNTLSLDNVALLIIEQDAESQDEMEEAIMYWIDLFEKYGIEETKVAQTSKEIEIFKKLRHMIPERINSMVKQNNQPKIGTDFSVPPQYLEEFFQLAKNYGEEFEKYQNNNIPMQNRIGYAIWAHAGDTHIHLNLIPRDEIETNYAKTLFLKFIKKTVELGGSIAAEHGLGKKKFDGKAALYYQYGQEGLDQIKAMKLAIDKFDLLNRGNLIG
ncbi:MAG: putative FAD-linked oxidoreductase [Candidatus Heimdallarchaeota archaeon LC_2]|nr:MAG: putative FAD-linked oxidoreductase [Candidatus Heimdallarchaeota archaeon LC_2]